MGRIGVAVVALLASAACTSTTGQPRSIPAATTGQRSTSGASVRPATRTATTGQSGVPTFDHIVLAVLENHAQDEVIGVPDAPFLDTLSKSGAVLTESYAITHPSEPNYLALFSGSTQDLSDDSCPHSYTGPNLAAALSRAGRTFAGYSEDLPAVGYPGCSSGAYARKHNPWADFTNLPGSVNQPISAFPADFTALPTVSFVIPNLDHDMHDGSVGEADEWLHVHLGAYARWALTHNSLLIVTTDEDDRSDDNHIPTIITGAHVKPGRYNVRIDHYGVLRTLLDSYRLPAFASAMTARPLATVWAP